MLPYFSALYANPSSSHQLGVSVQNTISQSRNEVAKLIGATEHEITFTSGSTEANNLAIQSIAQKLKGRGKHIVTVETEHSSVLEPLKQLETRGFEVTYLPVDRNGLVDLQILKDSLRADTIAVCVMLVNNETGVIQPVKTISSLVHKAGALVMTDATQAMGKMLVDVNDLDVDFLSFSGHKFHGPKGIGALYTRVPKLINPVIYGGGQEFGRRSGTLNVPAIVGFAKACEIASAEIEPFVERCTFLRNRLERELLQLDETSVNGAVESRVCNVTNLCFSNIDADVVVNESPDVFVSTGSACNSALVQASHVLKSMGLNDDEAFASIRFSLGKYTTDDEIDLTIARIKSSILAQRVHSATH